MKCIVNDDVVLSSPLEGPLSAHIAGFAKWARDEGYSQPSRHRQVLLAACFSRWLGQEAVGVHRITPEHPARYLQFRTSYVQIHQGDGAALRQFMDYLSRNGVVTTEKIPPRQLTPVELSVHAFEHYLRTDRSLAEKTIVCYVPFVHRVLTDRFGDGPVTLSRLTAGDVVRFVQR